MKRAILGLVVTFVLGCAMLAAAHATNKYSFSPRISMSNVSASPIPENGAISIAFDDNEQNQYDYAWPLMNARGMVGTFYEVTDHIRDLSLNSAYMSVAELRDLQNSGCEIGSHSKTHEDFPSMSETQIRQECSVSKQVLESYGFAVNNFAYPYGDTTGYVDSIVIQYYRSGRSAYTPPYVMQLPISRFRLPSEPGESGDVNVFLHLQSMVDEVYATKGWAIIFFHNVVPNPGGYYAISTQDFANFLDYLILKGVKTVTVNQALDMDLRDVAMTSVVPSTVQAVAGTIINVNVTARNEGAMTETFDVTAYYDSNKIETQTVADLAPVTTRTLTFNWNTNGLAPGNYTIKAEATTVPNETDTADNVYVDGTVRIVKPPTASFTYYPSNPRIDEPVLFDASLSTPNGGTITDYKWNFADGNTTSTPNPMTTHAYAIPRTYNVTLTITDSEGLNASAWNRITVSAPIQTEISIFTYSSSNFVGLKVEINGTLTDLHGNGISGANIIVSYTLPDISEWIPFISATTDFQGDYYSQWIPPSTGDFILKAEWVGTQMYAGANENTTLSIIPYKDKYVFSVASNSTVSALTFNSTSQELKFDATGPPSTTGSTRITIAKTLVANATNLKVYLDQNPLAYSTSSTDDSWIVSLTYTHSTHHITLTLNPSRSRGDANNDGQVNVLDLSIVAAAFHSSPTDTRWNPAADLDNNGLVNIADISIVANGYGKQV